MKNSRFVVVFLFGLTLGAPFNEKEHHGHKIHVKHHGKGHIEGHHNKEQHHHLKNNHHHNKHHHIRADNASVSIGVGSLVPQPAPPTNVAVNINSTDPVRLASVPGSVPQYFGQLTNIIPNVAQPLLNAGGGLIAGVGSAASGAASAVPQVTTGITSAANQLINGVGNTAQFVVNGVGGAANGLGGLIQTLGNSLTNLFTVPVGNTGGFMNGFFSVG